MKSDWSQGTEFVVQKDCFENVCPSMPVAVLSLEESSDFGWLFWLSLASLLMNFIACLGCCLYVAKWLRAPVLNDVHVSPPLPPLVLAADVVV